VACRGPGARILTARGLALEQGLPVALLLAVRDGQDELPLLDELRALGTRLRPGPLGPDAAAALVRWRLGAPLDDRAGEELCRECHASTGGNPFLLEALAAALRDGAPVDQAPEQVARAVLRRVPEAGPLTRALAVLGGPAPLRHAAALASLDLPAAARLADRLRAADVLAPGSALEFAHPIVRAAVYESIPPSERALAHAEAAAICRDALSGPVPDDMADSLQAELFRARSHPGPLRAGPGRPRRLPAPPRPPRARATGRSPSTCSSPRPRWRPTCGTPSASSASPPAPTSPPGPAEGCPVNGVYSGFGVSFVCIMVHLIHPVARIHPGSPGRRAETRCGWC
jgi:hypothetical protein